MTAAAVLEGWRHIYSGKVRDLYESEDPALARYLLVVASDRISAFDQILSPEITGKGEQLKRISDWWFERLPVRNQLSDAVRVPASVANRATLCKRLEMFPVECVVRGYLSGSGYQEYLATGAVCGIRLPAGLAFGDRLPEPIFTPAYKAPQGEHDENIDFARVVELVGEQYAIALRELSLKIFGIASALVEERGLILADTKFEFGLDPLAHDAHGMPIFGVESITLGDEVLTPDSSRYWSRESWLAGERKDSFDKQIVRNWLLENWDKTGAAPRLPDDLVRQTLARYRELADRLTGEQTAP